MNARSAPRCGARDNIAGECMSSPDSDSGLGLCLVHLWAAHDWIERDVGATDLLPSPCVACGSRIGVRYVSGWVCAVCEWRVGEVADGELPPVRVDVVYYLRFGD